MSYGIVVTNDAGELMIDEFYSNYEVLQSGTATYDQLLTAGGWYVKAVISYPTQPVPPLIFVRRDVYANYLNISTASAGVSSCAIYRYYSTLVGARSDTFDYVVCARTRDQPKPTSGHGLIVMDASGVCLFNSAVKQLKFDTMFSLADISSTTFGTTLTMPSSTAGVGRYICINNVGVDSQSGGGTNYTLSAAYVNDTQYAIKNVAAYDAVGFQYLSYNSPEPTKLMFASFS